MAKVSDRDLSLVQPVAHQHQPVNPYYVAQIRDPDTRATLPILGSLIFRTNLNSFVGNQLRSPS